MAGLGVLAEPVMYLNPCYEESEDDSFPPMCQTSELPPLKAGATPPPTPTPVHTRDSCSASCQGTSNDTCRILKLPEHLLVRVLSMVAGGPNTRAGKAFSRKSMFAVCATGQVFRRLGQELFFHQPWLAGKVVHPRGLLHSEPCCTAWRSDAMLRSTPAPQDGHHGPASPAVLPGGLMRCFVVRQPLKMGIMGQLSRFTLFAGLHVNDHRRQFLLRADQIHKLKFVISVARVANSGSVALLTGSLGRTSYSLCPIKDAPWVRDQQLVSDLTDTQNVMAAAVIAATPQQRCKQRAVAPSGWQVEAARNEVEADVLPFSVGDGGKPAKLDLGLPLMEASTRGARANPRGASARSVPSTPSSGAEGGLRSAPARSPADHPRAGDRFSHRGRSAASLDSEFLLDLDSLAIPRTMGISTSVDAVATALSSKHSSRPSYTLDDPSLSESGGPMRRSYAGSPALSPTRPGGVSPSQVAAAGLVRGDPDQARAREPDQATSGPEESKNRQRSNFRSFPRPSIIIPATSSGGPKSSCGRHSFFSRSNTPGLGFREAEAGLSSPGSPATSPGGASPNADSHVTANMPQLVSPSTPSGKVVGEDARRQLDAREVIWRITKRGDCKNLAACHSATESATTLEPRPAMLQNRLPHWNPDLRCWCLNFDGRVRMPSIKNFQLMVTGDEEKRVVFQFGKVKDVRDTAVFVLDFNPTVITPFQAFALALTSFDMKILL
eukprot:gene24472-10077_t